MDGIVIKYPKRSEALLKFYANCEDRSFLTGRPAVPAEERFWKYVDKTATCWLWTASGGRQGYGQFRGDGGKMIKAHVFSYKLHCGDVPKGLFVCHSCDVPACVNPEHLWLGTKFENNHDMIRKGRARYLSGPDNPRFGIGLCGKANGNFGKRGAFWVTNGVDNKIVHPGNSIPTGYTRGRLVDWSKRKRKVVRG